MECHQPGAEYLEDRKEGKESALRSVSTTFALTAHHTTRSSMTPSTFTHSHELRSSMQHSPGSKVGPKRH